MPKLRLQIQDLFQEQPFLVKQNDKLTIVTPCAGSVRLISLLRHITVVSAIDVSVAWIIIVLG